MRFIKFEYELCVCFCDEVVYEKIFCCESEYLLEEVRFWFECVHSGVFVVESEEETFGVFYFDERGKKVRLDFDY